MNNIQIFYHMYCISDSLSRFDNTYNKIKNSSLLEKIEKINVVLVGPDTEKNKEHLKFYHKVETIVKTNIHTEAETLHMLWNYCQTNNGYVLYLHSKGVTRPDNEYKFILDWRDLMEYFLIEKFELCLSALEIYDVCGVNYFSGKFKPHFSGNFWWATTNYVKKLKDIKPNINDRRYCEFWLFDTTEKINYKELHSSKIDHYCNSYPRKNYAIEL